MDNKNNKKVEVIIHSSWKKIIQREMKKNYFENLEKFVDDSYQSNQCFPPEKLIFNAFKLTPYDSIKVVLIGQDPYHQINQAEGLCFSVSANSSIPPSLKNIFKEINDDLNIDIPFNGSLKGWALQGVLLLNSVLTVAKNSPESHKNMGWEVFTDRIIKHISKNKNKVVFLLWGNYSIKKEKLIDVSRHLILKSGHPSPLSANRGNWFGNKHFSKTNIYLEKNNIKPIKWNTF